MKLTVLIPTYNRANLLGRLLDSIRTATIPEGLRDTRILVIDNNSNDDTQAVVKRNQDKFPLRLEYRFEPQQGKSFALNTGLFHARLTKSEWVGMIDDDEEVDQAWLMVAESWMQRADVDFFGGAELPLWQVDPPKWMPYPECKGPLAYMANEPYLEPNGGFQYRPGAPLMLMGGNAFVRCRVFEQVGEYNTWITDNQDHDMYSRLLAGGFTGYFVPEMKIYHVIPSDRVTRRYFLWWYFWQGAYEAERPRDTSCAMLFGVERWKFRHYAAFLLNALTDFRSCLQVAYFFGFLYRAWVSPISPRAALVTPVT